MTTAYQYMTLEEYLAYDDGTDRRYTLVDGQLVEMPSESDLNNVIALYVLSLLLPFVPIQRMRRGTETGRFGLLAYADEMDTFDSRLLAAGAWLVLDGVVMARICGIDEP